MEYKRMLSGGGTVKNGKRTQWSKAYDKDGKEIDFSKHDKDWFDEYGEPACENKRMNMNKKSIRLTESDIKRIVRESVNRVLREEWESPLDKAKKKRNDFDNVKKIDVSKFEKKSKKPKAGTFGDLPSFAKLKNRKDESRISKTAKDSVNEAYRYNYNSQAKARAFEDAISIIEKTAKKLQKMTNDESEFGGKAYEIGECATSILRLLDEYSLSDGGFNAWDMADYEANPDYDTRNLGDYGTDIDGNWMYDENPDDEGYQYWLNNTRKGRKYAKQNGI